MRLRSLKTLLTTLLLSIYSLSFSVSATEETYELYSSGSDYYLKAAPTWVPISGEIFVIIPVYEDGEILKLTQSNGTWSVESISFSEFNSVSPNSVANTVFTYSDYNNDSFVDIMLNFDISGSNQTLYFVYSSGSNSFSITQNPTRRVIFIHTDLLGSPAAETDENGNALF